MELTRFSCGPYYVPVGLWLKLIPSTVTTRKLQDSEDAELLLQGSPWSIGFVSMTTRWNLRVNASFDATVTHIIICISKNTKYRKTMAWLNYVHIY